MSEEQVDWQEPVEEANEDAPEEIEVRPFEDQPEDVVQEPLIWIDPPKEPEEPPENPEPPDSPDPPENPFKEVSPPVDEEVERWKRVFESRVVSAGGMQVAPLPDEQRRDADPFGFLEHRDPEPEKPQPQEPEKLLPMPRDESGQVQWDELEEGKTYAIPMDTDLPQAEQPGQKQRPKLQDVAESVGQQWQGNDALFSGGNNEVVQVLRDILEVLREIKDGMQKTTSTPAVYS